MKRLALILSSLLAILLWTIPAESADFVVHGVVSDVDGKPVTGAEVTLYRGKNVKKPADFASKRTAADGAYSVTVPQGQYWAVAVLRKGERRFGPLELGDKHSGDPVELTVEEGSDLAHDFTVMDLREAAKQNQKKNADLVRVSGRIMNQNGTPVPMAYTLADKGQKFKEMPLYLSAWTDASGEYLLLVPKGKLYLGATLKYPPDPNQTLTKEIDLTADQDGVDFTVTTEETIPVPDPSQDD